MLLALVGCMNTGDWITPVHGTVTDAVTGEPIESALVNLWDTVYGGGVRSDSAGRYVTGDLGYARWDVYCRKEGYQPAVIWVESSRRGQVVTGADFKLVPLDTAQ